MKSVRIIPGYEEEIRFLPISVTVQLSGVSRLISKMKVPATSHLPSRPDADGHPSDPTRWFPCRRPIFHHLQRSSSQLVSLYRLPFLRSISSSLHRPPPVQPSSSSLDFSIQSIGQHPGWRASSPHRQRAIARTSVAHLCRSLRSLISQTLADYHHEERRKSCLLYSPFLIISKL